MDNQNFTESDLFNALISQGEIKVFWKDCERRFVGANQSFLDFYGLQLEDILGKTDEDMGWHVNPEPYQNNEYKVIHTGTALYESPGKCIIRGSIRHIVASKMPVINADGDIVGLIGYFRDVTDYKLDTERLLTKATTDILTGLSNQRGLSDALKEYVDEYNDKGVDFAIIVLDINNFRGYNDAYGHKFGDGYLCMVADDLLQICENTSVIARLGGNYFVILRQIPETDTVPLISETILSLLDRIRLKQKEVRMLYGHSFRVNLAVGWSVYSEFEDIDEAMQNADSRMYADKRQKESDGFI